MSILLAAGMALQTILAADAAPFPSELVAFAPFEHNPLFAGSGPGQWDEVIRERGWILKEDNVYHMWYTAYRLPESNAKMLGYATSPDGIAWTRYPKNPIYTERWVEDMSVVKVGGTYYMFAEGANDEAHLLTSTDRIHWTEKGKLDIRKANGEPIAPGPFGTPTALHENDTWYLFYERDDDAIWLATSKDLAAWTNVQDEPVIKRGPEPYDKTMIAVNQVVKYKDYYYAYYHATCPENGPDRWSMNVAASKDLVHWEKHSANPIIPPDQSSGILVHDGKQFRLYCMHRAVCLYLPKTSETR